MRSQDSISPGHPLQSASHFSVNDNSSWILRPCYIIFTKKYPVLCACACLLHQSSCLACTVSASTVWMGFKEQAASMVKLHVLSAGNSLTSLEVETPADFPQTFALTDCWMFWRSKSATPQAWNVETATNEARRLCIAFNVVLSGVQNVFQLTTSSEQTNSTRHLPWKTSKIKISRRC